MAATLALRVALDIVGEIGVSGDLTNGGIVPVRLNPSNVLRNGIGTSQVDKVFSDTRQIAALGNDSLDLNGGGLLDPLGLTLVFAKLKVIVVQARSTNNAANNVVVTRPASNGVPWASAAGDAVPLPPGGLFVWTAPGSGVTVTAATGDLIDIANSAGTNVVDYDIVLAGTSA